MTVIGGKKGLKSILGLLFTLFCVFYVLIPMIFKGTEPVIAVIIACALTTLVTLVLTSEFSNKTLAAILGTVLGMVTAAAFSFIISYFAKLAIFNTKEAEELVWIASDIPLKLHGILFAGIIISVLGAVMDVGISIASAIYELNTAGNIKSQKQLFISGMNIGKDMMGTMTNTLILAFVGSSITLLILLYAYRLPIAQIINTDMIGLEIVSALSGTIGIVATVPITSYITSCLCGKPNRKSSR